MMEICPATPAGAGFISSMTGYVDCQAQVLGSGSWQALATPGSTLMVVLTGFLTIFVALIGYNLLLGRTLNVREGTLAFVKIGAVFALATSWPAYRTLVYDLVTDGPGQLVSEIGPSGGVVGSDGSLVQRLDLADQELAQLAILGPGNLPPNDDTQVPPPFAGFDGFALGGSRISFELGAVGSLGVIRIVSGLLLALGPFFIAFLLFENTRSLFEGWVRVLGGAALGSIGVSVALGLELAFIEPWVGNVLARRMAGEALPDVSVELFVSVCFFSMLVGGALFASARLTQAFRLAPLLRVLPPLAVKADANTRQLEDNLHKVAANQTQRSRAAAIASMLVSMNEREGRELVLPTSNLGQGAGSVSIIQSANDRSALPTPVGRSFTRRPLSRASASASRRDAGA